MGKGWVVLSHGLESGPEATKVKALGQVARELGWNEVRPDYRDVDASADPRRVGERLERLIQATRGLEGPLVLAGSSLGSFISGLASLRVPCRGLFLLAPPLRIPGYPQPFAAAPVATELVHGWDDELIPVMEVVHFAQERGATLHLVPDAHRLQAHVAAIQGWFARFLARIEQLAMP